MKAEDRFLYLAARQALLPEHQRRMRAAAGEPGFDWDLLFTAAETNGVAPLVYKHVTEMPDVAACLPLQLSSYYKRYMLRNTLFKQQRAEQLRQALEFFAAKKLPVIIIKGAAQDLLVNHEPWYTVAADIDLILHVKDEDLTEDLYVEINYKLYQKRIEFDFYRHHDMDINGMLPVDFDAVWQDARPIDFQGQPALLLSPEDHLLSICINSCRKRFFRLKSLFDIHESILNLRQIDWGKFCTRARRFQCGNIVYTALLVSHRTLETPLPQGVMGSLGISAPRKALIHAGVWYLLHFWSLSQNVARFKILKRRVDPTLILTYLTYRPKQFFHKLKEIRAAGAAH